MIKKEYPDVKLFLFGHSMGSFIARSVIIEHDALYSGVILSGTATSKGALGKLVVSLPLPEVCLMVEKNLMLF